MTGQFIENTTASGCFIVLQCEDGSPDQFIILPRSESKIAVASSVGNVRPSTYTTFVHDLEHNRLPHQTPSLRSDNTVTVTLEQGKISLLPVALFFQGFFSRYTAEDIIYSNKCQCNTN